MLQSQPPNECEGNISYRVTFLAHIFIKVDNCYLHDLVCVYLMTHVLSHPNHSMHVRVTSYLTFSTYSIKECSWMSGRVCNLKFIVVKMLHIDEMNAYNSFCASVDYEGEMSTLCRFPNGITLKHIRGLLRVNCCKLRVEKL